jgi:hypothetical protein
MTHPPPPTPTRSAAQLFERYFLPLYAPELRGELARARTTDANPAGNPRLVAAAEEIAQAFAKLAPAALGVELDLDFSDASVHRLAAALTKEARDRLLPPVDEPGVVPPLVHLVTHGAMYVGACVVKNHGGTWQLRNPLWESLVRLESRAGIGDLAIFQWWLKALSDEELGEPRLGDRYRANVEVPTARPEELPVIAPPDRKLPRLTKVRYDAFYRHLKAHLPELRDVGEHFPSAERFAELAFEWLEFTLLGEGRMLLIHGPSSDGVHLLWLDAAGFTGSMFFPADAVPEPRIEVQGDTLAVTVPVLGSPQRHELLWWGPSR